MEKFDVTTRIKELCVNKGISFYRLSKISGIPQTTLTNMLNRGTTPSIFTLEKICIALDISLSQFFDINDSIKDLPIDQQELLKMYIKLSDNKKELLKAYIQGLSQ